MDREDIGLLMDMERATNSPRRQPPLRIVLYALALAAISLPLMAMTCIQEPECRGDSDCLRVGAEFACFLSRCVDKATLPKRPVFEIPEPEQTPEEQTQPEPEQPPENSRWQQRSGVQELFQPCKVAPVVNPDQKCKQGLVCVRINALESRCFQDCSTNPSVCATNTDGYNECAQITYQRGTTAIQPINICVKYVQRDETCDPRRAQLCARNQNPHLTCQNATCRPATLSTLEGENCDETQTPPVVCSQRDGLVCNPNTNRCVRGVSAFEGDLCTTNVGAAVQRICERGHSCITIGGTGKQICLKGCDINNPVGSCSHRTGVRMTCRTLSLIPVCLQSGCTSPVSCALEGTGQTCQTFNNDPNRVPFCLPGTQGGSKQTSELCNVDQGIRCIETLTCITTSMETRNGFCTSLCGDDGECLHMPGNATCDLPLTGGRTACGYRCSLDTDCPPDTQCINTRCLAQ